VPPRARTSTAKTPRKRVPRRTPPPTIEGEVVDQAQSDGQETTTDGQGEEPKLAGAVVPFHGRDIRVAVPSIEQLVVMRRLANQYGSAAGVQITSAEEAVTGYDRALMSITSVVVDPADVVFLENLLLQGKTDLAGAGVLLREAMQALQTANEEALNREERRKQQRNQPKGSRGTARLATT
jgi:hypothetical protein